MSFNHETATTADLEARLQKFKRKAGQMNKEHFARALDSFPLASQDAVMEAVNADGPTNFFRTVSEVPEPEVLYVDSSTTAEGLLVIDATLKTLKAIE